MLLFRWSPFSIRLHRRRQPALNFNLFNALLAMVSIWNFSHIFIRFQRVSVWFFRLIRGGFLFFEAIFWQEFFFFFAQPNSTVISVESAGSTGSRRSYTRQYHTVNRTSTVVGRGIFCFRFLCFNCRYFYIKITEIIDWSYEFLFFRTNLYSVLRRKLDQGMYKEKKNYFFQERNPQLEKVKGN